MLLAMNRIFLIGYMGSGKTTVGQILATKLGYSFIDIDKYIEEKLFKSVHQIFVDLGEQKFRLLEQQSLHEIADFDKIIISTGGGTPCFFDNMKFINDHGISIYLKLSPEALADRLEESHANKRPLLKGKKGEELLLFIREGLKIREPFYSQAAFSVTGDIESTVSKICDFVENANSIDK
jgi:shikimate kinase